MQQCQQQQSSLHFGTTLYSLSLPSLVFSKMGKTRPRAPLFTPLVEKNRVPDAIIGTFPFADSMPLLAPSSEVLSVCMIQIMTPFGMEVDLIFSGSR